MNEYIVEIIFEESDSAETDPSVFKIVFANSEDEAIAKAIAAAKNENPERNHRKHWAKNIEKRHI